jgi:hypothetical protein
MLVTRGQGARAGTVAGALYKLTNPVDPQLVKAPGRGGISPLFR